MESPLTEIARKAYQAYDADRGGLNHLGNPNPKWEALPPAIQHAWKAAMMPLLKQLSGNIEGMLEDLAQEIAEATSELAPPEDVKSAPASLDI